MCDLVPSTGPHDKLTAQSRAGSAKKEGRALITTARPRKGTATGDWVEGVSPVGPATSKGIVPAGHPLKADGCV